MPPPPQHIVSASAYVLNALGETLLVRTDWRRDTWEIPGGQVEEGEPPHEAAIREVWEETGIRIEPREITGVYFNATGSIVNLVFRAVMTGGELTPSPETPEVRFVRLTPENMGEYLTRPHFRQRVKDAMRAGGAVYSAYRVEPFEWLYRIGRG